MWRGVTEKKRNDSRRGKKSNEGFIIFKLFSNKLNDKNILNLIKHSLDPALTPAFFKKNTDQVRDDRKKRGMTVENGKK